MVLLVRQAILRLVHLSMLVMKHSFFSYVGESGLPMCWCLCGWQLLSWFRGGFGGGTGKELLYMILQMLFSSSWYSSSCKSYDFNLSYKNLMAAYLCRVGWFEVYGIMVSVNVGFL